MTSVSELEKEAKAAADALENARARLASAQRAEFLSRRDPLKPLVERAHRALGQWNHTDGCAWGYEESAADPWTCSTHYQWLVHYDKIIHGGPYDPSKATLKEIEAIVSAIEALKPKAKTALMLLRNGRLTP